MRTIRARGAWFDRSRVLEKKLSRCPARAGVDRLDLPRRSHALGQRGRANAREPRRTLPRCSENCASWLRVGSAHQLSALS